MKIIFQLTAILFLSANVFSQEITDTVALRQSLDKATAAIRKAFENGDAVLVGQLHSPNVIKYFGGNNVIVGRDAVEKSRRETGFKVQRLNSLRTLLRIQSLWEILPYKP